MRFAREISVALGRVRPNHNGQGSGRVLIEFELSPETGILRDVKVKESSGNAALDALAVDSIRNASFPVPPSGLTAKQLTYMLPFQFK